MSGKCYPEEFKIAVINHRLNMKINIVNVSKCIDSPCRL